MKEDIKWYYFYYKIAIALKKIFQGFFFVIPQI